MLILGTWDALARLHDVSEEVVSVSDERWLNVSLGPCVQSFLEDPAETPRVKHKALSVISSFRPFAWVSGIFKVR